MTEDARSILLRNKRLLSSIPKVKSKADEAASEALARSRNLVEGAVEAKKCQELLGKLPQCHGSGLDADMVDGLHAVEIIARAPGKGGGGGGGVSGAGMVKHGNEWHTLPFAQKCCQICEVDELPAEVAGYAVLLSGDKHVYVGTQGVGNVCGCHFENVDELPESPEVGGVIFLTSDLHVYIGV